MCSFVLVWPQAVLVVLRFDRLMVFITFEGVRVKLGEQLCLFYFNSCCKKH